MLQSFDVTKEMAVAFASLIIWNQTNSMDSSCCSQASFCDYGTHNTNIITIPAGSEFVAAGITGAACPTEAVDVEKEVDEVEFALAEEVAMEADDRLRLGPPRVKIKM